MTTELFTVFIEHLAKYKTPGKCLLIFDDANCHLDFRIAETAEKHDIVLYCLPFNTTHELQPLTKLVTNLLNLTGITKFCNICEIRAKQVTKTRFTVTLSKVWSKSMTYANITSGFKDTGPYLLNADAIPETAFAPTILTERRVRTTVVNLH